MSTAMVLVQAGRRDNGRWKRDSVQTGNGQLSTSAWIKAVKHAGVVLDFLPDLAGQVVNLTTSLLGKRQGVGESGKWAYGTVAQSGRTESGTSDWSQRLKERSCWCRQGVLHDTIRSVVLVLHDENH